jgi:SAM-dependent methyltransferase
MATATKQPASAEFDNYAAGYDAGMDNPLKRMLGSSPEDYLRVKIDWLLDDLCRRPLRCAGSRAPKLLEYGCGHGLFLKVLSDKGFAGHLTGCDVSREMLNQAQHTWSGRTPPDFLLISANETKLPNATWDVVILCAVLHHIEPAQRAATYRTVYQALKPGGRVYVFEHNPLNPVTTYVVKRTPIDQNAILLRAREVEHGLCDAGFRDLGVCYQMFFPPRLRFLRGLERLMTWLPLGGQYAAWGERR